MEIPSLLLREALSTKLGTLTFMGENIPCFEEYVQETSNRKKSILTFGNMDVEAYIILLNQTTNDNSVRCVRNDLASIQIQITTVWPSNKGGSKTSELIAKEVLSLLLDQNGLLSTIELQQPAVAWKGDLVTMQNINFDANNSRTWITQLVMEYSVNQ